MLVWRSVSILFIAVFLWVLTTDFLFLHVVSFIVVFSFLG